MKTTGYQLREAIRTWELRRAAAEQLILGSLMAFKDDENEKDPKKTIGQVAEAECQIALLQTAQSEYNLAVKVEVQGEEMTLAEAVKSVGGAGRIEKHWRTAVKGNADRNNYGYDHDRRKEKDVELAHRTIKIEDALEEATKAAKYAGALRNAIAEGNNRVVDVKLLDKSMFP